MSNPEIGSRMTAPITSPGRLSLTAPIWVASRSGPSSDQIAYLMVRLCGTFELMRPTETSVQALNWDRSLRAGKLSLTRFRQRYYLFARANVKRFGGGRFVQVAVYADDDPYSEYGPFSTINLRGYDERGPGNIYVAAIKPNPLDERLLLGLFAVNLYAAAHSRPAAAARRHDSIEPAH